MADDQVSDQELLDRFVEIRNQVDTWVQLSEDRLAGLEEQVAALALKVEESAKQAHDSHTEVGMWTRQMYARIVRTENMLQSLAMSIAGVRTPVRMPPRVQPTAKQPPKAEVKE